MPAFLVMLTYGTSDLIRGGHNIATKLRTFSSRLIWATVACALASARVHLSEAMPDAAAAPSFLARKVEDSVGMAVAVRGVNARAYKMLAYWWAESFMIC